MSATKLVLDFLRQQGFTPEVDEENGNLIFKYQMATFLFINNENDDEFFQLIMPGIYDVTEENRYAVLEAANGICQDIKVVKACVFDDSVWLYFENFLDQNPEVSSILPRALNALQGARQEFYKKLG